MAINRKTYTQSDWDAINKKLEHPEEHIQCPRCGNEIEYTEIGNSISVSCKTEGCIFGGIRGL